MCILPQKGILLVRQEEEIQETLSSLTKNIGNPADWIDKKKYMQITHRFLEQTI